MDACVTSTTISSSSVATSADYHLKCYNAIIKQLVLQLDSLILYPMHHVTQNRLGGHTLKIVWKRTGI